MTPAMSSRIIAPRDVQTCALQTQITMVILLQWVKSSVLEHALMVCSHQTRQTGFVSMIALLMEHSLMRPQTDVWKIVLSHTLLMTQLINVCSNVLDLSCTLPIPTQGHACLIVQRMKQ